MRTVDEYMHLPYTVRLVHDHDDDGNEGYVADVAELPGVMAQGETIEEAAARVYEAMEAWLTVAVEDGKAQIPEPRDPDSYSGRFLVRLPRGLHAALAQEAEREGVSLNQFVTTALAWVAGSHHPSRDLVA
jgi:predicted RNase H-like HicB family nuclease